MKKGDLVEIHGRVESFSRQKDNGAKEYAMGLVVDKAWVHGKKAETDE